MGRHSGRPAHSRRKTTITISSSHLKDTTRKYSTIVALRGRQRGKCFRNQSRSAITAIQLRFASEIPNRKPGPKARTATSVRRTNQRTESLSGIPDNNPNQKIALNPKPANNSDSIQSQSTRQARQASQSSRMQQQPNHPTASQSQSVNSNQPIQPHQPIIPLQPPARHTRHGSQPERKKTW